MADERVVYRVSATAYSKALLHALRHPMCAVNGVLLGKREGSGEVKVVDAVPLFHNNLHLAPMLDAAMTQVEQECGRGGGMEVIGYYHANERRSDTSLSPLAAAIGDKIAASFQWACIFVVDNEALAAAVKKEANPEPCVKLFTKQNDEKKWQEVRGEATRRTFLLQSTADSLLEDFISEGRHKNIVDFDDHLVDVTSDWLNRELLA